MAAPYVRRWRRVSTQHYALIDGEYEVARVSADHWSYDPTAPWEMFGADGVVISKHKTAAIAKKAAEREYRLTRLRRRKKVT